MFQPSSLQPRVTIFLSFCLLSSSDHVTHRQQDLSLEPNACCVSGEADDDELLDVTITCKEVGHSTPRSEQRNKDESPKLNNLWQQRQRRVQEGLKEAILGHLHTASALKESACESGLSSLEERARSNHP